MNTASTATPTSSATAPAAVGRSTPEPEGLAGPATPGALATAPAAATEAIDVAGLRKSFGAGDVLREVDLVVRPGAVVALLGPSGCGKTTLLRTVAGLERPDAGEVRLGGRLVAGPATHVPPERRHVGMVFQDWALFPHLTVGQNVGYGLPRSERRGPRVTDVLEMVGLGGLGKRQPATLSGGQQQRVALARALAPRPGVLLLDEPFSNLDTALRAQVRSEVHELLTELGVTTVFVTHDQEEAFVLGDEVAVMHGGRIVQQASPAELYARPASPWVATFVGDANIVPGEATGDRAETSAGPIPLDVPASGPVDVLLRPEELRLDSAASAPGPDAPPPAGGAAVPATVELSEFYGHDTVYVVRPDGASTLRVRAGSAPRFRRGDRVGLRYAGPPAVAFPARDAVAGDTDAAGDPQTSNGGATGTRRTEARSTDGDDGA